MGEGSETGEGGGKEGKGGETHYELSKQATSYGVRVGGQLEIGSTAKSSQVDTSKPGRPQL